MKGDIPMIKCILIIIANISLIGLYLFVWSCFKAASNADDELEQDLYYEIGFGGYMIGLIFVICFLFFSLIFLIVPSLA